MIKRTQAIKEKYQKSLKIIIEDIEVYEKSGINELRIAAKTLKVEAETLGIIRDALEKRIPMKATYVYDDEFICPACGHEDDGYDVKTLKLCPDCGQMLDWEREGNL